MGRGPGSRGSRPPAMARGPSPVHAHPSPPQVSVPGNLGTAILPGLGGHAEYEITILAYYGDGARSEPVSLRYTPRRSPEVGAGAAKRDPRHPSPMGPGPRTRRTADKQFPKSPTLWPDHSVLGVSPIPPGGVPAVAEGPGHLV